MMQLESMSSLDSIKSKQRSRVFKVRTLDAQKRFNRAYICDESPSLVGP